MPQYYLRVEAVNLEPFLADTQDLHTIRGGSLLLLHAVERIPRRLHRTVLEPLTTGASIGLYTFEAPDEPTAQQIRALVAQRLHTTYGLEHATVLVDIHAASDDFQTDLAALTAQTRWQQMQSPTVAIPAAAAPTLCAVDQVRPATRMLRSPEGKPLPVSEAVYTRRRYGQRMKQAFYTRELGTPIPAPFVHDLNALTHDPREGNLHHKMAVLYLDGNRFGAIKQASGASPAIWQTFDATLKAYRRAMLQSLLARMQTDPRWQTADGQYRFETLLWGGDEILWVVPAWQGWQTLACFYEMSADWTFHGHALRHAAGLVFCHYNAPIHRITHLARQLADLAKEHDRAQNLVAYEVLEAFDHIGRDLVAYRTERSPQPVEPQAAPQPATLLLQGEHLATIRQLTQEMHGRLPRRPLHALAAHLLTPRPRTTVAGAWQAYARERQQRQTQLSTSVHQAGIPATSLAALAPLLRGEEASWLHLNTLWDYLV